MCKQGVSQKDLLKFHIDSIDNRRDQGTKEDLHRDHIRFHLGNCQTANKALASTESNHQNGIAMSDSDSIIMVCPLFVACLGLSHSSRILEHSKILQARANDREYFFVIPSLDSPTAYRQFCH